MKFRTMLGLAGIGGILYMHRKRGGEWTLESFKDSARQLWRGIEQNADRAKRTAKEALDEAARKADKLASKTGDYRHEGERGTSAITLSCKSRLRAGRIAAISSSANVR